MEYEKALKIIAYYSIISGMFYIALAILYINIQIYICLSTFLVGIGILLLSLKIGQWAKIEKYKRLGCFNYKEDDKNANTS